MANQDAQEVTNLANHFSELSRLIPTQQLVEYDSSLNRAMITTGKTSDQIDQLSKSFGDLTKGTALYRGEAARLYGDYTARINPLIANTQRYTEMARIANKIDPFNAAQRMKEMTDLSNKYGYTIGRTLDQNVSQLERQQAALRVSNLLHAQGAYDMAAYYRKMAEGTGGLDDFGSKAVKAGTSMKNASMMIADAVGHIQVLKGALDGLGTTGGGFAGLAAGTLATMWGVKKGVSLVSSRVLRGGVGGGVGAGGVGGGGVGSIIKKPNLSLLGQITEGWHQGHTSLGSSATEGEMFLAGLRGASSRARNFRVRPAVLDRLPFLGRGGKLLPLVGAAATGYSAYQEITNHDWKGLGRTGSEFVGGALGAVAGGAATGGIGGEFIGGAAGSYGAGKLFDKLFGSSKDATAAVSELSKAMQDAKDKSAGLQNVLRTVGTAIDEGTAKFHTPGTIESETRSNISARQKLLGQEASMGMVGPSALVGTVKEMAASISDELKEAAISWQEARKEAGKDADKLHAANMEYETRKAGLQGELLNQLQIARRSYMEQMIGGIMGGVHGSVSMPGELSTRQLYGPSYQEFMPLAGAANRPQQPKFSDIQSMFMSYQNQVGGSIGHAGGGLIPGTPSSSDNTIAKVATGEYIVNSRSASKYKPLLDKINFGRGYAVGGMVTNPSLWDFAGEAALGTGEAATAAAGGAVIMAGSALYMQGGMRAADWINHHPGAGSLSAIGSRADPDMRVPMAMYQSQSRVLRPRIAFTQPNSLSYPHSSITVPGAIDYPHPGVGGITMPFPSAIPMPLSHSIASTRALSIAVSKAQAAIRALTDAKYMNEEVFPPYYSHHVSSSSGGGGSSSSTVHPHQKYSHGIPGNVFRWGLRGLNEPGILGGHGPGGFRRHFAEFDDPSLGPSSLVGHGRAHVTGVGFGGSGNQKPAKDDTMKKGFDKLALKMDELKNAYLHGIHTSVGS